MGRQLRKVPANWEHPTDEKRNYIPLLDGNFSEVLAKWEEGKKQWDNGFRDNFNGGWQPKENDETYPFEEWSGGQPEKQDYMPEWSEAEKTHIQLYENTTEGTPCSPVYKSSELEALCEWAAENATTFADYKATKEEWFRMLSSGTVHAKMGNITFI